MNMIYDIISCFEVNNGLNEWKNKNKCYVSYILFAYFSYLVEYYSRIVLLYAKTERVKLCIDTQFQCLPILLIQYEPFL